MGQAESHWKPGRADVYALGVLIYKLLTGDLPFDALRPEMIPTLDHSRPPAPSAHVRAREVSSAVDALVRKALAVDAELRFQSMKELAAAVEASLLLPDEPTTRVHRGTDEGVQRRTDAIRIASHNVPRFSPWIAALLVLSVGVVVAVQFSIGDRSAEVSARDAPPDADEPASSPAPRPRREQSDSPEVAPPPLPNDLSVGPETRPAPTPEPAPTDTPAAEPPDLRRLETELRKLAKGCKGQGEQRYRFIYSPGDPLKCTHLNFKGFERCLPAKVCRRGKLQETLAQPGREGTATCTVETDFSPPLVGCK